MSLRALGRTVMLAAAVWLATAAPSCHEPRSVRAPEIRWDGYGVPHIFANGAGDLFYAFGWAQMQSHGNLMLNQYGKARGRAAEYWGASQLESDVIVHTLEIPETGQAWYAAQDAEFRGYIDRFVAGINDYASSRADAISVENKVVLPVGPADVFAHLQCVLDLGFIGRRVLRTRPLPIQMGSNALGLAPSRTVSGKAMLLVNPHLPWSGLYTMYEAHFKAAGRDLYGVTLVGLPVLVMAFNNHLGWAHTRNEIDGADLYEVEMHDEDQYLFDGQLTALRKRSKTILVKEDDGERRPKELMLSDARQGPVLWQRNNKAYAYRSTRTLYPFLFKQYWQMGTARNLKEFREALELMQLPLFNVVYADRDGHILYLWDGLLPDRAKGDSAFWAKIVPGNTSDTLWTKAAPYSRLPQILDPPSGWVQNTNDPPWTATWPSSLDRKRFPACITGVDESLELRTQQILNTLSRAPKQSLESLREIKFQNRMEIADRTLDDLLRAIETLPGPPERQELLEACRAVLAGWDRRADAESRGAVLFKTWVERMGGNLFARPFSPDDSLRSPAGLKDPQEALAMLVSAAEKVRKQYGALEVKWGDVYRLKRGAVDVPASGGPDALGIFHAIEFGEPMEGRYSARSGESYSALIEFSDPVRAEVLLSYGNSSEEDSPHYGDQLALVSQKVMRRALLSVQDIDQNLERREVLPIKARQK